MTYLFGRREFFGKRRGESIGGVVLQRLNAVVFRTSVILTLEK